MDDDATDGNDKTALDLLGGDALLQTLVARFYALMDEDPAFAEIRNLHPPTLEISADKLYRFLSGWLGGPPLYAEKYGAPMLRARHLPFPIGARERDQWMSCMRRAMDDCAIPAPIATALGEAFQRTADWMRNKPGDMPGMPG